MMRLQTDLHMALQLPLLLISTTQQLSPPCLPAVLKHAATASNCLWKLQTVAQRMLCLRVLPAAVASRHSVSAHCQADYRVLAVRHSRPRCVPHSASPKCLLLLPPPSPGLYVAHVALQALWTGWMRSGMRWRGSWQRSRRHADAETAQPTRGRTARLVSWPVQFLGVVKGCIML